MDDAAKLQKQTEYKQQRMVIRKLRKKSKVQHYHEALKNSRTNPKDTWHLLRQLVPGKSKQNNCNFQNITISASTFNNIFARVGEKSFNDVKQRRQTNGLDVQARHERTHLQITRKSSLWSPQPVQAADIILAISKLKDTKSTGHDQINLQHFKESLMGTIPYIALIINTSIVTNLFPKPWKHSIIIPIHKSGDIEKPTNFRPTNLLPILSKYWKTSS